MEYHHRPRPRFRPRPHSRTPRFGNTRPGFEDGPHRFGRGPDRPGSLRPGPRNRARRFGGGHPDFGRTPRSFGYGPLRFGSTRADFGDGKRNRNR
ncbi:hypothetical protein GCM10010371_66040 [Streptomyces subrutilus]|uniref:Uncharacterized protein n=1 Tax=Streptomyces subrutilus TaxID=36818 RepID=A0A918RFH0_9ACTN|nr:hypothetical protein GCM10010371_66040 [Streptomyces subrutilus]